MVSQHNESISSFVPTLYKCHFQFVTAARTKLIAFSGYFLMLLVSVYNIDGSKKLFNVTFFLGIQGAADCISLRQFLRKKCKNKLIIISSGRSFYHITPLHSITDTI